MDSHESVTIGVRQASHRGGVAWGRLVFGRRVLRGGSWNNNPDNLRSANRNRNNPDNRNNNIGFRLVCRPHLSPPWPCSVSRGGLYELSSQCSFR